MVEVPQAEFSRPWVEERRAGTALLADAYEQDRTRARNHAQRWLAEETSWQRTFSGRRCIRLINTRFCLRGELQLFLAATQHVIA